MRINKEAFSLSKKLLWALLISASINVIAFAFYVYEWQEGVFPFVRIQAPVSSSEESVEEYSNPSVIAELALAKGKPKAELFSLLQDKTQVSDGFLRRDCALAALVSFHCFDIERAFDGSPMQTRRLALSPQDSASLFAGLVDSDYEKLLHFIEKEKWPFTSEGLFLLLQNEPANRDPSLVSAFMRTDEYADVKAILSRNTKIPPELASELVFQGSWQDIVKLSKLKSANDETLKKAKKFYIQQLFVKKPELACEAMFLCDQAHALQTFNDAQLLYILQRFKESPAALKEFAIAILQRPRSDKVWQEASLTLCMLEKLPPEYADRKKILEYLSGVKSKPKVEIKKPSLKKVISVKKQDVFHVVQKGDSLWSIAKKYNISIEQLRKSNKLQSDALKPGTKLLITRDSKSP